MDFDHSLSGSQRAVTVFVAPFCTEVSDPETSPRRASSHAELVPGVFHTPSAIGGASSVTEIATCAPTGATCNVDGARSGVQRIADQVVQHQPRKITIARGQRVDTDIDFGLCPDCPRQGEDWRLEILHTRRAVATELRERQRLPQPAVGRNSKLVKGGCDLADFTGPLLDEPQMSGERAVCLADHQFAPSVRLLPERGRAAPS